MHKVKMAVTAAVVFAAGLAMVGAATERPAAAETPAAETPAAETPAVEAPAVEAPSWWPKTRKTPVPLPPPQPEAIKAFLDDGWGVSLQWGPCEVAGVQVNLRGGIPDDVYKNLYKKWKPDQFDARQLVDVVKRSGARYLIFCVKDRDGFNMYDTKFTDYKITGPESPWKHDVLKEIADACHAQGLKLHIVYYRGFPPSGQMVGSKEEFETNQLRELLTNYGRIEVLWGYDLHWGTGPEKWEWGILGRTLQPHILLGRFNSLYPYNDIDNWDFCVYRSGWRKPMARALDWGYWVPASNSFSVIPRDAFIRQVAWNACAGISMGHGITLMPDGRLEPEMVELLLKVGEWMGKYGESIYETRSGPFEYAVWGGTTYRGKFIYMHVLDWPGDKIHLKPMERKIVSATVLTGGTATVTQTDQVIEIQMPLAQRDRTDTIIKLELDGPVDGMKPIPLSLTYESINDEYANAFFGMRVPSVFMQYVWFHKPVRSSDGDIKPAPFTFKPELWPGPKERPEWSKDFYGMGKTMRVPSMSDADIKRSEAMDMPEGVRSTAPAAVDGIPHTRWDCGGKGVKSAWLEVDLRKKETFSCTAIYELLDRVRRFELQVRDQDRDDEPWRTVYTGTTIGRDFYATFPATTARYVRLNLIETTDAPSIVEFQVW